MSLMCIVCRVVGHGLFKSVDCTAPSPSHSHHTSRPCGHSLASRTPFVCLNGAVEAEHRPRLEFELVGDARGACAGGCQLDLLRGRRGMSRGIQTNPPNRPGREGGGSPWLVCEGSRRSLCAWLSQVLVCFCKGFMGVRVRASSVSSSG